MSENIPSSYLLAGSRLSSLKTYISTSRSALSRHASGLGDERQSWKAWAGQKIKERRRNAEVLGSSSTAEIVEMFPSWATRRYVKDTGSQGINR